MQYSYPYLPQGIQLAYVRELDEEDRPAELPTGKIYGIHDADGNRLAIAPSRDMAFAVIRRNDMMPVSVH